MRVLPAVIFLCSLASPALADCESDATAGCQPDVLLHPLPGDDSRSNSRSADDPSLYADPALAPGDPDNERQAPNAAEEDTPDIDPYTLNPPPE